MARCYAIITVGFLLLVSTAIGEAPPPKIGIAYFDRSAMAERVLEGFSSELTYMQLRVNLDYRTELPSLAALKQTVAEFERSMDAMIILRSTGVKWLASHTPQVPTFVAACNHPRRLGVIQNPDAPEGNITGVTYYLPRETQWEIFLALLPRMSSIFLLLEKGHPSSDIDLDETLAYCKRQGISVHYRFCSSVSETLSAIADYQYKVSAVVLGTQALFIDNTRQIVSGYPDVVFLSYNRKPVEDGALGGFVADDFLLGRKLAVSVRDVLIHGKAIREVPVKMDTRPKFAINVNTAKRLRIAIPFDILQTATLVDDRPR